MPVCTTQFEWEYFYMTIFGKDLEQAHEAYKLHFEGDPSIDPEEV